MCADLKVFCDRLQFRAPPEETHPQPRGWVKRGQLPTEDGGPDLRLHRLKVIPQMRMKIFLHFTDKLEKAIPQYMYVDFPALYLQAGEGNSPNTYADFPALNNKPEKTIPQYTYEDFPALYRQAGEGNSPNTYADVSRRLGAQQVHVR